jgi:hypothetical protein
MYAPLSAPVPNCPAIHEIALGQNVAHDNVNRAIGEGFVQLDKELAARERQERAATEGSLDDTLIHEIDADTYALQRYTTLGRIGYWANARQTLEGHAGRHAVAHACYGTCDPAPGTLLREVSQKSSRERAQARGDFLGKLQFGTRRPRTTGE